ncbi:MAG: ChbG/HpnK family deacetylase [Nitrospirae bacterium]|nr:ChbG/HpnK family deacetylase [Nitrospirota bacterium]
MLIINADDWGKNRLATNNSLTCFKNGRITSVSAMVFMEDSERSAELALENSIDVGLHLNFTEKFSSHIKPTLKEYHQHIANFLLKNKYCSLVYNPFLKKQFDYVYKAQYEEFVRLYNRIPTHINGHKHMHLCTNMIIDKPIPKGFKVRRSFSFASGEKSVFNRFYRYIVDKQLTNRYICTDFFFSISPVNNPGRLQRVINISNSSNVELMVHPEKEDEYNCLMSAEYLSMISNVKKCAYSEL